MSQNLGPSIHLMKYRINVKQKKTSTKSSPFHYHKIKARTYITKSETPFLPIWMLSTTGNNFIDVYTGTMEIFNFKKKS